MDDLKNRLNELHNRMLAGSRTASRDLFTLALKPLIGFLAGQFPSFSNDDLYDLASDAIMIYVTHPHACDTGKSSLWSFLCRIAKADAIDLLRKTANREELLSKKSETDVEFWATRAKDVFRDEEAIDARHIMQLHGYRLVKNESEARVLTLILKEEDRTAAYAEALGVDPGAPDVQRTVKQAKDRMLLRMKRLRDEL
jgi:DNA-directed RNA polymerase specialized sigma24 family protein